MGTPKRIGIAELIGQVREEIDLAQENLRKSGKSAKIDWESAEIEISFGVTKAIDGKGTVNFHIFAIEAGGDYKSEEVHRLNLKLKPHGDRNIKLRKNKFDLSPALASIGHSSVGH
jgi:hypothetical protein